MTHLAHDGRPHPRTQTERSAAMKRRLIEATLETLHEHGYGELTIGRVVAVAGVSRGAPLHHFTSKAALVEAATASLVADVSQKMLEIWKRVQRDPDPIRQFSLALWKDIFLAREGVVLAELSHASRRAPELAEILTRLWTGFYRMVQDFHPADSAGFGGPAGELSVGRTFMLSQWLMRGMHADVHLGASKALFEAYLNQWVNALEPKVPPLRDGPGA